MNREQELRQRIIHRILDNECGPEERQALKDEVAADPLLAGEFDAMARAVDSVKRGHIPAPAFFTSEVMKKLPEPRQRLVGRIQDFLFKGRIVRWNMATAIGALAMATLAVVLLLRLNERPAETAGAGRADNTVTITMNLYAPDAHRVTVAGTFNKWKTDADLLRKGKNGYWTISIPLEPGDYSYMFVVDGSAWVTDPNAESYRDDGFGYKNAVLRVKT